MKIITEHSLVNTERDTHPTGCRSIRIVVESDNMGFSIHKTIIPVGPPQHWHYKHHLEACYCIAGRGELRNLSTGGAHPITPGTVYLLDAHDDHTFQALEETVLISIFNPPVNGTEVHDETGNYPPSKLKQNKAHQIVNACDKADSLFDAYDAVMEIL